MSNTKLSQYQKTARKSFKQQFLENGCQIFTFGALTIAIKPVFSGSTMAEVSTSFAATAETKIRRKVGEFHALNRMYHGEVIQVPLHHTDFEDFARNFSDLFGN